MVPVLCPSQVQYYDNWRLAVPSQNTPLPQVTTTIGCIWSFFFHFVPFLMMFISCNGSHEHDLLGSFRPGVCVMMCEITGVCWCAEPKQSDGRSMSFHFCVNCSWRGGEKSWADQDAVFSNCQCLLCGHISSYHDSPPSSTHLSLSPGSSSSDTSGISSRSCLRLRFRNRQRTKEKEETKSWWPVWESVTAT